MGFDRKHVRAGVLEGFGHWGGGSVEHVLDCPSHLGFLLGAICQELLLESLTKDLGKLNGSVSNICAKDEGGVTLKEVTDELEVLLSLSLVVAEGEQAQPVLWQVLREVALADHVGSLVLDDLADTGDGVVTGVVVLGLLDLFVLNLGGHCEID